MVPAKSLEDQNNNSYQKVLFFLLLTICLWPRVDNAIGLGAGILFSLIVSNPFLKKSSLWSKILLQTSVIGLGFGIGIEQVISEGKNSILYTLAGICFTLMAGRLLGKALKVHPNTSHLISFGTAICGGSAIAAMAPVIKAKDEETAISLATVFMLNSLALVLFPFIGKFMHMDQQSFGLWAALAIHDTSSVVGAAASFGTVALGIATTVKLTRALWIAPSALTIAFFKKEDAKIKFPFFILGFLLATGIRSLLPSCDILWNDLSFLARRLLVVTLFLIGAGLTKDVLKKVGFRPMIQGILLWIIVSIVSMILIKSQIIHCSITKL